MKTLKAIEPKKLVTWSLVVMFSLLQIAPTGWAAQRPVDELQARSVPGSVDALANLSATPKPAPAPQRVAGFVDSTAFQLNENPLSPATPVAEPFNRPVIGPGGENPDSKPFAAPFNRPVIGPGGENPNPALVGSLDDGVGTLPGPITLVDNESVIVTPLPEPPVNRIDFPHPIEPIVRIDFPHPKDASYLPSDPITKLENPETAQVITDPATGKELSVTVDEHGIATVKWGDEEYKGFYDSKTKSIILVTDSNAIWTLQFSMKENGELYLQTFKTEQWTKANGYATEGYAEETYTFNEQGQLTRKEWLNETGVPYSTCMGAPWRYTPSSSRSGGTIDYVTINGKTLVSHEKTWSESNGLIKYIQGDMELHETKYLMPRYPYGRTETESWYSYDSEGNLLAKNWHSTDSFGGSTFGQEIYVHINGRDLVSVRRIWEYNLQSRIKRALIDSTTIDFGNFGFYPIRRVSLYASYHSETFYNYDAEGNLLSEVTAWEGFDRNNVRHTGGSYWLRNAAKNTWTFASAEGIDPRQVWSSHDYAVIETAAQRKTVYVGGDGEWYHFTHRVEYTRHEGGTMMAKAVYDSVGNVSIVVGQPDVLSGEADDIKFQNGQQVNGRRVYYQEYWHADANGNWVSDGYQLVFSDQNTGLQTTVDFPNQTTVTLDGKEYKIEIGQDGKLTLTETIPPAVQAYIDALKEALGEGYRVEWALKDGNYQIIVAEAPSIHTDIRLLYMNFELSADGIVNPATVKATYGNSACDSEKCLMFATQIIEVDGQLLFEAMAALEASFHPEDSKWMVAPWYYAARLTALATQIVVRESGENLLRFDHKGTSYKAYRDAEGKVILEKELTPAEKAIAAVKANLAKVMGLSVEALDALIESITVDQRGVLVKFKEGKMGNGRLIDVLGSGKLPTSARFRLDENQTILSAKLEWGERGGNYVVITADVSYLNGQISEVGWSRETGYFCDPLQGICQAYTRPTEVELLYRDVYSYSDATITINRGPFFKVVSPGVWQPTSVITLQKMEDGRFHISEVKNYKDGKLVDVSHFDYLVAITHVICAEGAVCTPPSARVGLFRIVRTDANGNLISEISNIFYSKFGSNVQSAIINLPNGASKEVSFASLEELLDLARQFEQENAIPPAVQAYVDALREQLGPRYLATVEFSNGAYEVKVTINPEIKTPVSSNQLNEMSFILSAAGELKVDSLSVSYGGVHFDAQLLFEGMKLLKVGIPENADIRALALLSQIKVNQTVNSSIVRGKPGVLFEYQGVAYRVYRNAEGKVVLEKELPPAVQAFVDQLNQQLEGSGYAVTGITAQADGAYLVSLASTVKQALQGHLGNAAFVLNAEGLVVSILQVAYVDMPGVDGQLLYEAMGVCPEGQACTLNLVNPVDMLKKMTQITVTKIENGAIFYTLGTKNYKAYRDKDGQVKVKEEAPFILPIPEIPSLHRVKRPAGGGLESLFPRKTPFTSISQSRSELIEDAVELIKKQNAKKHVEEASGR